jgi:hypothetical protein
MPQMAVWAGPALAWLLLSFLQTANPCRFGTAWDEQGAPVKHRNSHLLVGYWSRIRDGRPVPDQTDINPKAIKRLLPFTFILNCEHPSRPYYRLAGTGLCERFGSELKGTGFLAFWDGSSATAIAALLRQSLCLRQPVCLFSMATTESGGIAELETVVTPVSFNGGEARRLFGLVQVLSDPGLLVEHKIVHQRLIGSQLVAEGDVAADGPAATRPDPRLPAGSLRLVVSQVTPQPQGASANPLFSGLMERVTAGGKF